MHPKQIQTPTINQQQLKRWISCLALVTFDLQQGQKVQYIVPSITLNDQSIKQLAMLSFPDSNSFSDYENSFKYTFRMYNGIYGYSCFKQKKDPTNPRGFSQKSFVLLSELPFVHFFEKFVEFVVFKTFNLVKDEEFLSVMVRICQQICRWPDPQPRCQFILPVLEYQLSIEVPNYKYPKCKQKQKSQASSPNSIKNGSKQKNIQQSPKQQQNNQTTTTTTKSNSSSISSSSKSQKQYNLQTILTQQQTLLRPGPFQQLKLCQTFLYSYELLWTIWQKVMLNKSILLFGSNPQLVSHAVLCSVSIIYPFQYCGYFNPYVTVYDPNIEKIGSESKNWVCGGSNPLFNKFFNKQIIEVINIENKLHKCNKNLKPSPQILLLQKSSTSTSSSPSSQTQTEQSQAITESYLRKHFHNLSKSVLQILDTYLIQQTNDLKFFNQAHFLKWIKDRKQFGALDDVFTGRKFVLEFFQAFVGSCNFGLYLSQRNAVRCKNK